MIALAFAFRMLVLGLPLSVLWALADRERRARA